MKGPIVVSVYGQIVKRILKGCNLNRQGRQRAYYPDFRDGILRHRKI